MTLEVLSRRALSRATLQRQLLLERVSKPVADVVVHLVGMQAQNPLDPYYALWARLEDFDPSELATATEDRQMVRGGFMRGTIHLFTADDGLAVHPVTASVLERVFKSTQFAKDIASIDRDALLGKARSLIEEGPLTRAELGRELGALWPECPAGSLGQAATYLIPVVQVPPRGVWGKTGQARWAPVDKFLGQTYGDGQSIEDIVRRYLGAFGPAAVKDMRAWSGLSGLKEVFDRLRPQLRTYRNENGSELFDLPDVELPDPDTPAPPRLLPEYDNVLLGHADRSRFFAGDAVPKGWAGNVLVDGIFAGSWKRDGAVLELSLTEHGMSDEESVRAEAARLVRLAWPNEVAEIEVSGF
jgi:hypothetical protein